MWSIYLYASHEGFSTTHRTVCSLDSAEVSVSDNSLSKSTSVPDIISFPRFSIFLRYCWSFFCTLSHCRWWESCFICCSLFCQMTCIFVALVTANSTTRSCSSCCLNSHVNVRVFEVFSLPSMKLVFSPLGFGSTGDQSSRDLVHCRCCGQEQRW